MTALTGASVPASPISPVSPPTARARSDSFHVVLVDDDDYFRESIAEELAERRFGVTGFADGKSMLGFFRDGGMADVLLLDWRLGGESGLNVLKRARQTGLAMPIIIVTGLATTNYESDAFDNGASDFVDKARGPDILAKRIRRALEHRSEEGGGEEDIVIGRLRLRPHVSRAFWKDVDVNLTVSEFNIVKVLASKVDEYVSYRAIYDRVRCAGFIAGSGEDGYRTNVRSSMKRIRNKFRAIDDGFIEIENFPAFGYRWRASSAAEPGKS